MGEQNENPDVPEVTDKPAEPVVADQAPAEKPVKAPRKAADPKAPVKAPEAVAAVPSVVVPEDLVVQLESAQAAGKNAFLVTPTTLRVDA